MSISEISMKNIWGENSYVLDRGSVMLLNNVKIT